MKVENMDVLKTSSVLPSGNEGLHDSHAGLIKAINNLDLNDDQCLLHLDCKSEEDKKLQCLLPLKCTPASSKGSMVSNGYKCLDEGDVNSRSNTAVHVKNNVELFEICKTTTPVKKDESVGSNKESPEKMNNIKPEDLSAFFSELSLDKKSSFDVKCSVTEACSNKDGQDQLSENLLSEKTPGSTKTAHINGALLKENADSSIHVKHTPGRVLDSKVGGRATPNKSVMFLTKEENAIDSFSKKDTAYFTSIKSEVSSENQLVSSDSDDDDLIERGYAKKDSNGEQKEKKIISGRAQKATENASKYLKSFPKLHMSGGLIVGAPQHKTLNATSGYLNLVPFDDSSGQRSSFIGSNMQTSSLPAFFDPNPLNPVIQGSCLDNSCLFPTSCENDNLLDIFSLPTVVSSSNNSVTSFVEVQNQSTEALETENLKSNGSCQQFFDCLDDVFNHPSPVSEISSYHGQSSRSTSPESGYGSSPRFSPFSDDSSEQCRYKNRQHLNSSTSLDICSPPPCVPSEDEFIDNWDMSIFDDMESPLHGNQPTDEESKKRINVIKQDLKKCEELCKANSSDILRNGLDTLSVSFNTPDSQSSQNLCSDMSSSLQGYSTQSHTSHQQQLLTQSHISHQQQLPHVNTATQVPSMPSAQVNTPQVVVIYVPYAVNGTDKGSKSYKPIEPDPEGQRLLARSPRECLKEKLDKKKQMHYLYKITENLPSGNKNVIYIENDKTRQTNLHLAVIKQDLELAYCILEVHKKCNGDLSMVNCRDIYKKTALQYAIRNVMTVFVEYLKDYGAK